MADFCSSATTGTLLFSATASQQLPRRQLLDDVERQLRVVHPEAFLQQDPQQPSPQQQSLAGTAGPSAAALPEQDAVLVPWFLRSAALHCDPGDARHHANAARVLQHAQLEKRNDEQQCAPLRDHNAELSRAIVQTLRLLAQVALPLATPAIRDCDAAAALAKAVAALEAAVPDERACFATDELLPLPERHSLLCAAAALCALCLKSFLFHGVVYGVGDAERTKDFTSKLLPNFAAALADVAARAAAPATSSSSTSSGSSTPSPVGTGRAGANASKPASSSTLAVPAAATAVASSSLSRRGSSVLLGSRRASSVGQWRQQLQQSGSFAGGSAVSALTAASNAILFFAVSSAQLSVHCVAFCDVLLACVTSCDAAANALLELLLDALRPDGDDGGGKDVQRRVLLCGAPVSESSPAFIESIVGADEEPPTALAEATTARRRRCFVDVLEFGSASVRLLLAHLFCHSGGSGGAVALGRLLVLDMHGSTAYCRAVVVDLLRSDFSEPASRCALRLLTCGDDEAVALAAAWRGLLCVLDGLRELNGGGDCDGGSQRFPSRAAASLSWLCRFLLCNATAGLANAIVSSFASATQLLQQQAVVGRSGAGGRRGSTIAAAAPPSAAEEEATSIARVVGDLLFGIPSWMLEVWRRRGGGGGNGNSDTDSVATMRRMLDAQAQLCELGLCGPCDLAPLHPGRSQPAAEHHVRALLVEREQRRRLLAQLPAAQVQEQLHFFFAVTEADDASALLDEQAAASSSSSAKPAARQSSKSPPPFRLWAVAPLVRPTDADEVSQLAGSVAALFDSTFGEQLRFLESHLPREGHADEMRTNWSAQRAPQHVVHFAAASKKAMDFVARSAQRGAAGFAHILGGGGSGIADRLKRRASSLQHEPLPALREEEEEERCGANEDDGDERKQHAEGEEQPPSPGVLLPRLRARMMGAKTPSPATTAAAAFSPARSGASVDSHVTRMRQLRERQEQQRVVALEQEPGRMRWHDDPPPLTAAAAAAASSADTAAQRIAAPGWSLTPSPGRNGRLLLIAPPIGGAVAISSLTPSPTRTLLASLSPDSQSPSPSSKQRQQQQQEGGGFRAAAHARGKRHRREVQARFDEIERRRAQQERDLEPAIDKWYAHLERDETRPLRLRMWTGVHQRRDLTVAAQRDARLQIEQLFAREWLQVHEGDVRTYVLAAEEAAAWRFVVCEAQRSALMARSFELRRGIAADEGALLLALYLAYQRSRVEHLEAQERRYGAVDEQIAWIRAVVHTAQRSRHCVAEAEQRRAALTAPEARERHSARLAEQRGRIEASEAQARRAGPGGREQQAREWRLLMQREQRARVEAEERTRRRWLCAVDERCAWLRGVQHPMERGHLAARAATMLRIWAEVEAATRGVEIVEPAARGRIEAECTAARRVTEREEEPAERLGLSVALRLGETVIVERQRRAAIEQDEEPPEWRQLGLEERARRARLHRVPMPFLALIVESRPAASSPTSSSFVKAHADFWALPSLVHYFDTEEQLPVEPQLAAAAAASCDPERRPKEDRAAMQQREAELLERLRYAEAPESNLAVVQSQQYRDEAFRMLVLGGAERALVAARADQVCASERNRLQLLRAAEQSVFGDRRALPAPSAITLLLGASGSSPHLELVQSVLAAPHFAVRFLLSNARMLSPNLELVQSLLPSAPAPPAQDSRQRELLLRHEAALLRRLASEERGEQIPNNVDFFLFAEDADAAINVVDRRRRHRDTLVRAQQQRTVDSVSLVNDFDYKEEGARLAALQRAEAQALMEREIQQQQQQQREREEREQELMGASVLSDSITHATEFDVDQLVIDQLEAKLAATRRRFDDEIAAFGRDDDDGDDAAAATMREMRGEMVALRDASCAQIAAELERAARRRDEIRSEGALLDRLMADERSLGQQRQQQQQRLRHESLRIEGLRGQEQRREQEQRQQLRKESDVLAALRAQHAQAEKQQQSPLLPLPFAEASVFAAAAASSNDEKSLGQQQQQLQQQHQQQLREESLLLEGLRAQEQEREQQQRKELRNESDVLAALRAEHQQQPPRAPMPLSPAALTETTVFAAAAASSSSNSAKNEEDELDF